MVVGDLRYKVNGCVVDCSNTVTFGISIPAIFKEISDISSNARMILVIEKHTIFVKLAQRGFHKATRSILITGRGQPDMAIMFFLSKSYVIRYGCLYSG